MALFFCKRLLLLIVYVFTFTIIFSQTQVLKVYSKDGNISTFSFRDKPVFSIEDKNLLLTTNEIVVTYPLAKFGKYTINEIDEYFNTRNISFYDDQITSYSNTTTIDSCNIRYIRLYKDTEWQSLYVPFDIDVSHYSEVFEFAAINNIRQYDDNNDGIYDRMELEIRRIFDGTLMANYPYLIKSKKIGIELIELYNTILYKTTVTTTDCSSVDLKFTFIGIYDALEQLNEPFSDYYYLDNGLLVKCYDVLPPAFRWYLKLDAKSQAAVFPKIMGIKAVDDAPEIISSISNCISTPLNIINIIGTSTSQISQTGFYIMMMKDGSSKKILFKK